MNQVRIGESANALMGYLRAARNVRAYHQPGELREEAAEAMAELICSLASLTVADVGFIKNLILADFDATDKYVDGLRQGHYDAIAIDIGCPNCENRLRIPAEQHKDDCALRDVGG